MGVGIRVAPGVALGVSSRGVRASLGPRAARVGVGGGGPLTLGTGLGPVSVSTSIKKGRKAAGPARSSSPSAVGKTANAVEGALALVETLDFLGRAFAAANTVRKESNQSREREDRQERERLAKQLENEQLRKQLTSLHCVEFAPAQRTVLEIPQPTGALRLFKRRDKTELAQIDSAQTALDALWEALLHHDTHTVIQAINEAFADNHSPSTCIDAGIDNEVSYVTALINFPARSEILPIVHDMADHLTPQSTMKSITKVQVQADTFYRTAIASTILATANEALAVSPSTERVWVVVISPENNRWKRRKLALGMYYLGAFDRKSLEGVSDKDPIVIAENAIGVRLPSDRIGGAHSLDLKREPELAELLATINDA